MGAQPWTFRYKIPLREGITREPYRGLFFQTLTDLAVALRNKTPGDLIDPYWGVFRCVPADFNGEIDALSRDGTDINVEFTHSPEIDELEPDVIISGFESMESDARSLDDEVARIDWEQELPPEATVDPLSLAAGIVRSVEYSGNKVLSFGEQFVARAESVENALDSLEDPRTFGLKRRSRRMQLLARRTSQRAADPFRGARAHRVATNQTLSELAAEVRVTVTELVASNRFLARTPIVPAGTVISVPQPRP
jgi:hypothetical protein